MANRNSISIPKPKPGVKLELGLESDVHAFEVVARTMKVDEEVDAQVTENTNEIKKLEEDGADWLPIKVKTQQFCGLLDILLAPTDGKDKGAGDLAWDLYESGDMTSDQIKSIYDQVLALARPT